MEVSTNSPKKISLLHATYRSRLSAEEMSSRWINTAGRPERIEYIFAMDDTDEKSVHGTKTFKRVVTKPREEKSTAVCNWNAAASVATGDLLMVIADDLIPPVHWDIEIEELIGLADCARAAFVVKVNDSSEYVHDTLARHPIVSRRFYEKFGLFDQRFRGVYCDNDITLRAFFRAELINGKHIVFEHDRPSSATESQAKQNREGEFVFGSEVFNRIWGLRGRLFNPRRLALASGPSTGATAAQLLRSVRILRVALRNAPTLLGRRLQATFQRE